MTPSGNILCGYVYGKSRAATVRCLVMSGLKPPPRLGLIPR